MKSRIPRLLKEFLKIKQEKKSKNKKEASPQETQGISADLSFNVKHIKQITGNSTDIVIRNFQIGDHVKKNLSIIYTDGLSNSAFIQEFILDTLMLKIRNSQLDPPVRTDDFFKVIKLHTLPIGDLKEISNLQDLFLHLLSGDAILLLDGCSKGLTLSSRKGPDRGVQEPSSQTVIRGLILVETPIEIIMLLFILTSLIGVRLGLEVISRSLLIFFPWIIMLLFFLTLFLIPEIKVENIQPILEGGIKPVLKGTFHQLGIPYLQLIIFLMITPYVNEKANMRKYFYKGMVIGGMVLLIVILLCIWVLNVKLTSFQSYPVYTLGKKINVANFFNRIEVVVAIIWVITTYFKLTICFYGLSLGLAQMINLKNYQILLFPLSLLIFSMSIFFYPDVVFFNDFALKAFIPFLLIICFILPLSLLITAKVRAKITKQ